MAHNDNLYIVHLSIHGLIRGTGLELGRDADTGGQCKYVLELVKALGRHPRVGRVDLFTRSIIDPRVSEEYGQPLEDLGHGAFIRRIEAGPRRYLRKESLWRYLDAFLDKSLMLFRETGRLPDLIHAHYADAGYIGSRLSTLLGCPFVFTGHSLGRTKRQRLLDSGADSQASEKRYNLSSRIEAEELALDVASRVVTSTQQEVEQQYSGYEFYDPDRMRVIPPGVDVSRFSPPGSSPVPAHITEQCDRFLDAPAKPAILTIARADEKKNLATLVRAYGESATLREQANLILIAGNRSRIRDLNPGARKVWTELLQLVDDYDLYGHIAIPKHHQPDDIPAYYRHAAASGGVFVNPAWTEPFGLTLIEAAASGLPILATNDGGPRDIIANCENGVLIDPADVPALTATLERVFGRPDEIARWSENGIAGVDRHYTWEGHVARYLEEVGELVDQISQPNLITEKFRTSLPLADRLIVSGLEERLESGDAEAIAETARIVRDNTPQLGFAIASGRSLGAARQLVEELGLPRPDFFITQLGAEIHYGTRLVEDTSWTRHLAHRWQPDKILEILAELPGLELQEEEGSQHQFKISYHYNKDAAPSRRAVQKLLRESRVPAKVLLSEGCFLDVIPIRSGKGQAIRYVALRWGIPLGRVLVYARRGSDHEALSGHFLAVMGSDHSPELKPTKSLPRVYLAESPNFRGLVEGIKAYEFDSSIIVPESAESLHIEEADDREAVLGPDTIVHSEEEETETDEPNT